MTNKETEKCLWGEISVKQREIGNAYDSEGSTERVLALSRELDELLNRYAELRTKMQKDLE